LIGIIINYIPASSAATTIGNATTLAATTASNYKNLR
jgi:hypothetical protein